jgi:hypothetical protein
MGGRGTFVLEQRQVVGCCEHDNETSSFIKYRVLDLLPHPKLLHSMDHLFSRPHHGFTKMTLR